MPFTPPTVNVATTMDGTYTTIAGIQNLQFNRGRQRYSDPFASSNLTIEMLAPTNEALIPVIGNYIDIRATNSSASEAYFVGKVTDVSRKYDIPYTSATNSAPGDRIYITVRGALGLIGQYETNDVGVFQVGTSRTILQIFDNFCGVLFNTKVEYIGDRFTWPILRFQSQGVYFDGSGLDTLNQLARTNPYYFSDYDNARVVTVADPSLGGINPGYGPRDFKVGLRDAGLSEVSASNFTFSDTGSIKYDGIEFLTGNQNNYSFVLVSTGNNLFDDPGPTGVSIPNPIPANGGYYDNSFAPYTTLAWTTNSMTNDWSNSLGAIVYNRTTKPTIGPFSITTTTAVDSTALNMALMNTHFVGETGSITFRGTTYKVSLEGVEVSMTPDQARVTCYFSPFPGDFFILDSTTNGVLDVNKLGYP
jgi:hypothetical protein